VAAQAPRSYTNGATGTVRSAPNVLSTMNPRITPGVSHPSPRPPAPYHTTSGYLPDGDFSSGNTRKATARKP